MKVKEFMTPSVHTVTLDMTVREAIEKLTSNQISGAPIVDSSQKVVSVVSEGNLLKLAAGKNLDKKISQVIGQLPKSESLIHLSSASSFIDAYRLFLANSVHRIIIMDANGKLQGIVSRSNVLRILVSTAKDALPTEENVKKK